MSWDKTEGGDFGHSSRSENFIRGLNIELANERNLRATAEAEVERLTAEIEQLNNLIANLILDLQMVATDESTEGYPCICSICALNRKCPDEKRDPYSNKDSLCKFVWRGLKDGHI